MRYCHQCHRLTTGEPLYCNHCGSTYDVKLCPARHMNPRTAEACSQCGSRDFSTPAPRLPFWLAPLFSLLSILPGVVLLLVTVFFLIAFVQTLVSDQQLLGQAFVAGLVLAFAWWLYLQLPEFIRKLFRTVWTKGKTKDRSGH